LSRPRLLIVPWIGELEWSGIEPQLSEWADVITYDPPGVGDVPLPEGISLDPRQDVEETDRSFERWRRATAERGLAAAEERGWKNYMVVADSLALGAAVRAATSAPERVRGVALGHASLAHTFEGDRPTVSKAVWDTMQSLIDTDHRAFIGYGISQMTQGAVDEDLADAWLERIPDGMLVTAIWRAIGRHPEPIEEPLRELDAPLLLAGHRGCLLMTEQGFEDAFAAFPDAQTVSCPEACAASPAFAEALRELCAELGRERPWDS
jgi:pimeloyl-ACP methyl ester carboxylesterase